MGGTHMPWSSAEQLLLLAAWREADAVPEREKLLANDETRMRASFLALGGDPERSGKAILRQRERMVQAFRFVEAFNRERKRGGPAWFELPRARREKRRRAKGGLLLLEPEVHEAVGRFLRKDSRRDSEKAPEDPGTPDSGGRAASLSPGHTETDEEVGGDKGGDAGAVSGSRTPEEEEEKEEEEEEEEKDDEEIAAVSAAAPSPTAAAVIAAATAAATAALRGAARSKVFFRDRPPLKWKLRDELQIIRAWDDVLHDLIEANEACAALDPLILKRYIDLGGPSVDSLATIGAKRAKIQAAFDFLSSYLKARPHHAPEWFAMTASERLAELKEKGHGKQAFASTINSVEYGRLTSIAQNQTLLDRITSTQQTLSHSRTEDTSRSVRRPLYQGSMNLSIETDTAVNRSSMTNRDRIERTNDLRRLLLKKRRLNEDSPPERPRHQSTSPINNDARYDHYESPDNFEEENVASPREPVSAPEHSKSPQALIDQLLQAQSRRLELMLEEFREERREERQLAHDMLLMVLSTANSKPRSNETSVLEALIQQQQRQLEYLFDLLEAERDEDRYDSHATFHYPRR